MRYEVTDIHGNVYASKSNQLAAEEIMMQMLNEGFDNQLFVEEADEEDFLLGKACNPDAPEECESCQ